MERTTVKINDVIKKIKEMKSQDEVSYFEERLGLSQSHETYAETAYRLEESGDWFHAEIYTALEAQWFEVGGPK